MLHNVHQIVANCVCLLYAAEQVAQSGSIRAFVLPTAAAAAANQVD